ncbi:hypothetical protein [Nocardia thraciensis]
MIDDVEKRWHDPDMFRRAAAYVAGVLAIAVLVGAAVSIWAGRREACAAAASNFCDTASRATILAAPGTVLTIGTVGAFIATYHVWKQHRAWPIWQGAGWFLMTVTLAFLALGATVAGG